MGSARFGALAALGILGAIASSACKSTSGAGDTSDAGDVAASADGGASGPCRPGDPAPFNCEATTTQGFCTGIGPAPCVDGAWSCGSELETSATTCGEAEPLCTIVQGTCVPETFFYCPTGLFRSSDCPGATECCQYPVCAALGGVCDDGGCPTGELLAVQSSCGYARCCAGDAGANAGADAGLDAAQDSPQDATGE